MAKTPKIRFKNFSDEWVESRLGELGNILTGSTPPTNISELYDNNGIPWVTPTDITSNLISKTCKRLSKKGELVSRIVPSKTILVTCIASIGKNAMLLTRGSFNQQINSLTVNDNNDPYFMLTQSSLWSEQMKKQAAQATMQIVNKTEFSNIKAYIPNLKEQEKIGAFFSKLDKLISLHQSKFEKLQKIKKSCLQNLFPQNNQNTPKIRFKNFTDEWLKNKLCEVAEFNPKSELPYKFEYVDLESVVGTEMISHRTEIKESAPSRAQRLAKIGDIFFQTVRPYQKNNYLFLKSDINYVFSTGYAQIRPNINATFLMSYLQTDNFVKIVLDNCTGTSYPAINSSDLSNLTVVFPLLIQEQEKIGAFFSKLDKLIALHQSKFEKLQKIKKSCLQNMFV